MANESLLSRWARLGGLFNVPFSDTTPDIEQLLFDTAASLSSLPRLLPVCVTWLVQYHRLVCRHRLAGLTAQCTNPQTSAAFGLLLQTAGRMAKTEHFNLAAKQCTPIIPPKPLFESDRLSDTLAMLAHQKSSPLGLQWGLWSDPVQLAQDAVRPLSWLLEHNPSLKQRAIFNGNLRASILQTLAVDQQAGQSESQLARHCFATRKAVRDALDHLEFCQLILRRASAGKVLILLC